MKLKSKLTFFSGIDFRVILFTAAVVRLLYVFSLEEKYEFYDTIHYDTAAKSLLAGNGFGKSLHYYDRFDQYCLEPVYPLFMAAAYAVLGQKYLSVRLFQTILSLLLVWLVYKITKEIKREAALWAAGIAAVYPFFIYITGLLYSTLLFSVLLAATVYFFILHAKKRSLGWVAAAFASLSLGVATIPVIAPALVLYGLWLIYFWRKDRRRAVAALAVSALVSLVILAPWTIRNWRTFGVLSPGRACLAETRVFEELDLQLRYEDAMKKPVFDGKSFMVEIASPESAAVFTYFLDGQRLGALKVVDPQWRWPDSSYWGIILYGGSTLRFPSPVFSNGVTQTNLRDLAAFAPELSINSDTIRLAETPKGWNYAAVMRRPKKYTRLTLDYPQNISPQNMQRLAFLIGLDSPSLAANGYMIWLHPHKAAYLWKITSGRPERAVKVIDLRRLEQPMTLSKILAKEPIRFFTRHFFIEFLHFWSPVISRISSVSVAPSRFQQLISFISFAPLLLFGFIGLIFLYKERNNSLVLLLLPILTLNIGYAIFFAEVRYRIPIDTFLIVSAAVSLEMLFRRKPAIDGQS
ncbi:MAG: glycosyltransferase family 39 protein [candidate division KSB1 bacterium]|nr:glycosyltransferase family 39 protein [candidate division KSB1 bacterium]